ncbi:MAG: cyclic nucleotide-binding domain-containing protein [Deltaproteobacteria bacterium]|nr:cyclic nucleotide-binding domain-containing protein [Deltaproteobacteria bacterium]
MGKQLCVKQIPDWMLVPILDAIPFFRTLRKRGDEQVTQVLDHSIVIEVKPGEPLFYKGEIDNCLYFVLLGTLMVYPDTEKRHPVGAVYQGEMLGEMALISNLHHTATIVGDPNCVRTLVLRLDYSPFGKLEEDQRVPWYTKVALYRSIVTTLLQRIKDYQDRYPEFCLDHPLPNIPPFHEKPESVEEIQYLSAKAVKYAHVLDEWNHQIGELYYQGGNPRLSALATLVGLLDKGRDSLLPRVQKPLQKAAGGFKKKVETHNPLLTPMTW